MNRTLSKLSISAAVFLICAMPAQITPQTYDFYGRYDSGIFGIMDRHFQGVLFPEVYKNLVSAKVNYPGLWTAEKNTAAAGFLPGYFSAPGAGWSGAYGWADLDNGPGTAGVWAGNIKAESGFRMYNVSYDSIYYLNVKDFSLRGAVWITPFRSEKFLGLSVTVDIDNSFAYDGNEYWELLDINRVYVNVASLIRIGDSYCLKTGLRTYNMQGDDPEATRFDNSKIYSDGFFIGLLDDERRTLELRVDNTYGELYSWEKHDTLSMKLQYTQGEALNYMRHTLFYGIKADVSAAFLSNIGEDVGTFEYAEYMRNLTADGWIFRAGLTIPVALDFNIHDTFRCMLSIGPRIEYASFDSALPQHELNLTIPHAELSFRGTAGRQFDFAFKPTISNNVFISALEVRYKF